MPASEEKRALGTRVPSGAKTTFGLWEGVGGSSAGEVQHHATDSIGDAY